MEAKRVKGGSNVVELPSPVGVEFKEADGI